MRPKIVAILLTGLLAAGTAHAQAPASGIDAARAALERGEWAAAKAQLDPLLQRRDPRAQVLLAGLHYARGGTGSFAEDPDTACDLYDRAAAANTGDGLFGLARCFAEGRGRPQDAVEAMRLFDRAAEKGATRAWCAMGKLYFDGAGVRADQSRGIALCRQGSSMGDPEADLELGLRYLNGVGLPKSFTDARPWLDRAAQRGNAQASRALAQAYATGNGVARDTAQSLRYLEQAAKAGDLDSALQMTSQRAAALVYGNADRRLVIDSMYWLAMISRAHPDPKRRELAKHDLEDLRTRFANLTMEADFRIEKEPLRTALPQ
jgi:uncharacterized protein